MSVVRATPRTRFPVRWAQLANIAVAVVLSAATGAALGGDPEGRLNLASRNELPSGSGLAAAYPGDAGLKGSSEVIFADDFETGNLGDRWDETGNKNGKVLQFAVPEAEAGLGKRCLRVEAHLGQDTGGGLTKWFEPADTVFIRFYTRFDPGCDYVHHFVTLRANRGLRGGDKWSGFGGAGAKPEGSERFSTAIEPWGNWGRWTAPGRWKGTNWRKTAELKANALTLESYVTDLWTKNPVNVVFFDNVVISQRYIGPIAKP